MDEINRTLIEAQGGHLAHLACAKTVVGSKEKLTFRAFTLHWGHIGDGLGEACVDGESK